MKEGARLGVIGLAMAAVVVALLFASPSAASQGDPGEELSHSYLYLTGEEISMEEYEEVYDEALCREVPVHGTTFHTPVGTQPVIVPSSPQYGHANSCSMNFIHTVDEGFTFQEGAGFTFWLDCNYPYGGVSGELADLRDYQVQVTKNGEIVGTATGTIPAETVGFCNTPFVSDLIRLDATFQDQEDVRFEGGDELWIWVWVYPSLDPTGDIVHLAVDSFQSPSALHGVGFPGPLRAGFDTTIVADVPSLQQDAGPGNATDYAVVLQNIGEGPREVRVSLEGPDAWAAMVEPVRVTVPAGGTAEVNVTVRAPMDATAGTQADHAVRLMPAEEDTIKFTTTTHVLPGEGFPLVLPGEEIETAEVGTVERIGDIFAEVWIEAFATMIVGGIVTMAHLVRKSTA